jgi:hypothetical protein
MINNGPEQVEVMNWCGLAAVQQMGNYVEDEAMDLLGGYPYPDGLEQSINDFGQVHSQTFEVELADVINISQLPLPIPIPQWEGLNAIEWHRVVSEWMTLMGMDAGIPPPMTELASIRNLAEVYAASHAAGVGTYPLPGNEGEAHEVKELVGTTPAPPFEKDRTGRPGASGSPSRSIGPQDRPLAWRTRCCVERPSGPHRRRGPRR